MSPSYPTAHTRRAAEARGRELAAEVVVPPESPPEKESDVGAERAAPVDSDFFVRYHHFFF